MPLDTARLNVVTRSLLKQLPCSVVIGAKTYTGARTMRKRDKDLGEWGAETQYEFSVELLASDFTTATTPTPRSTVTIGGIVYRVLSVTTDPSATAVTLDLGQQYHA